MLQDAIKMPPAYEHMNSLDSVMNWFKTVPLEDRRKLYKLYEKDFKLFGYKRPDEVLDGWDKVTLRHADRGIQKGITNTAVTYGFVHVSFVLIM